ncbi:MAG: phosphatidate cytidylyltransferase [Candidatus Kapabacteria bacterium]|nr:phosphatidate cytidylyltransferase [Candidatus Kapabacteria bacterium]
MSNLVTRVLVGLVGIPVIIGIVWFGGYVFNGTIMVLSWLALREFYMLAESKHAAANRSIAYVWSIVLQGVVAYATTTEWPWWNDTWLMLIMGAFVLGTLATLVAELWRERENSLLNTAITVMGVAYVTVSMSALMLMHAMPVSAFGDVTTFGVNGAALVLTTFVSVWAADTVAYFVGMAIGKHKLFPRVSPKKSWEGAIGGGLGATAAFAGMSALVMPSYPTMLAVIAGLIVGVAGPIGDLMESLLKRDAAIKDSSSVIPGHGGVLDRFDSMLLVAPVLLAYMLISMPFVWPLLSGQR